MSDKPPITNPEFEHGCFVFRTSAEDQKRIANYNWKAIGLLADELAKRRQRGPSMRQVRIMREVIRTDGTTVELHTPHTLPALRKMIGADTVDVVRLHHMGVPLHVMLVDDSGYDTELVQTEPSANFATIELRAVRARKPVNERATKLYWQNCVPGTTHQIVGDVVVIPDDEIE